MKRFCNYIFLIIIIIVWSVAACTKAVHIDLNSAKSTLVIDADMSNLYGLQVRLSRSVDFYDSNSFPPVNNALVVLQNLKTNKIDTIPKRGNGEYFLNRKPIVGTGYQLTVKLNDTTYTAISTMPTIVVPDSITFTRRNLLGSDIISAQVNFQDPVGVDNYYVFRQYILKNDKWSFFSFSDRLSDGRYIRYNLDNDKSILAIGDSLAVNMQCVDKNVYKYFSVVESISGDDNGFGNPTPANPPTNIVGNALGIFNVHSDYIKKVKVPSYIPWQ